MENIFSVITDVVKAGMFGLRDIFGFMLRGLSLPASASYARAAHFFFFFLIIFVLPYVIFRLVSLVRGK